MSFTFDRDYSNLDQVAEFYDDYLVVFNDIVGHGRYPYNADFEGRIPGIEGDDEQTAICLLQTTRHIRDLEAKRDVALADGYVELDRSTLTDKPTKFAGVIEYGYCSGGTGWRQWEQARLLRQDNVPDGVGLLPKGKRTSGHWCFGKVLVKV